MLLIMKRVKNILLVSVSMLLAVSCLQKPVVSVNPDFTTDKDVYEIYEDVKITNTSTSTNDIIIACKWEWGSEHFWGKQFEQPLSFDSVGEKEIKLTVVTDSGVSGTCTKTITVQDTNKRPVADFSYSPSTGIMAGDEVQFTDKSTLQNFRPRNFSSLLTYFLSSVNLFFSSINSLFSNVTVNI